MFTKCPMKIIYFLPKEAIWTRPCDITETSPCKSDPKSAPNIIIVTMEETGVGIDKQNICFFSIIP